MEKEKIQKAVALLYEKEKDIAPRIVAKGYGEIAKKIIDLAKKHNLPIWEDKKLVELLIRLEIGEYIPAKLYKVVAEILSFIYKIEKKQL